MHSVREVLEIRRRQPRAWEGYLENLESFEYRRAYIPEHIDDFEASHVMWYLIHRGYLDSPYYNRITGEVEQ